MLIKTTPDAEKAKAILKMIESTLRMIRELNPEKFPSQIIKEYYDILRELISIIALLDGYRTLGEGAHKELMEYIQDNYHSKLEESHFHFLNELRIIRNKITYDGFFVNLEYVKRNEEVIITIIKKLKDITGAKLR